MTIQEECVFDFIKSAVLNKNHISFNYINTRSKKEEIRIVEPHLIGTLDTTGNTVLRAWFLPSIEQIANGDKEDWKLYRLDSMSDIKILPIKYLRTRQNYNIYDAAMRVVLCHTAVCA